jgi:hypothetical protein
MDELKFKYDVMYLTKEKCEVKRVKRKPFLKMLSDPFTFRTSFVLLGVIFLILMMFLPLHLLHMLSESNMMSPIILFLIMIVFGTKHGYGKYKNMTILIGNIKKIYVNKNGKIMRIKFMNSYGSMGIKYMDLPDNEHERQYIINQLNERNLLVIDKR